jgi:hypothetical protein
MDTSGGGWVGRAAAEKEIVAAKARYTH